MKVQSSEYGICNRYTRPRDGSCNTDLVGIAIIVFVEYDTIFDPNLGKITVPKPALAKEQVASKRCVHKVCLTEVITVKKAIQSSTGKIGVSKVCTPEITNA